MVRLGARRRGRLEQAALELYVERGFEETSVWRSRTCGGSPNAPFSDFADKREVLFGGPASSKNCWRERWPRRRESLAPLARGCRRPRTARGALRGARRVPAKRRPSSRANPELQERELIKLASLAAATAETLGNGACRTRPPASRRRRGSVFKIAFGRWVIDTKGTSPH